MIKSLKRKLLPLLSYWPPLLGAGIRIDRMSSDFKEVDVSLRMKPWNTNYVGVHYGGSLYSMTDAFYMLMLIENLGPEYIVWDKAATIRFIRPGKGTVRARFRLTDETLHSIRVEVDEKEKIEPVFLVQIHDEKGQLVSEVEKTLYVRKKQSKAS